MLRVCDLSAAIGDHVILEHLSLTAEEREIVAILGPSGCGKTTLLRTIAGLQPISSGEVHIAGRDVTALAPHDRDVGLMFQHFALFPHLDVGRNVEFGLRMRHVPPTQRRERVVEVLDLVGLTGFERRRVENLSGGEQQRVALARALAPSPRVLMLDEPLGALDRTLRDRLLLDLQSLFAGLGTTVVYVTHDQAEALAVADRVAVMREGRIVQTGTPRELWEQPADQFVARFLGFSNLFPVEVGDGVARTGWGLTVATPPGAPQGTVLLVPPTAVHLSEGGDGLPATVLGHAFQGERTLVRMTLPDGTDLEASIVGDPPAVGAGVQVDVDDRSVRLIDAEATGN